MRERVNEKEHPKEMKHHFRWSITLLTAVYLLGVPVANSSQSGPANRPGGEAAYRASTETPCGEWGAWKPTHWKGLKYRLKCECEPATDQGVQKYSWNVELRNSYPQTLHLRVELTESNKPPDDLRPDASVFGGAFDLEPHQEGNEEEEQKINFTWSLLKTPCGGSITVWIGRIRLGAYDSPYLKPDNTL